MPRRHPKNPHAARVARVARAEAEGLDPSAGKWVAVCDKHGTFVAVRTKRDAASSSTTDFCDDCRYGAGMTWTDEFGYERGVCRCGDETSTHPADAAGGLSFCVDCNRVTCAACRNERGICSECRRER